MIEDALRSFVDLVHLESFVELVHLESTPNKKPYNLESSVSFLGIDFHSFSLAELYQLQKSHLHVFMKKIEKFPKKSVIPKFR